MATSAQQKDFIKSIAPIIQKYAKEYGYHVASPVIAQACIESAYGRSSLGYKYHNYFGMKCGTKWKGKSVNLSTMEEYTQGTLTSIKANFRVYDSMEEGVKGYFDFISGKRYENLKSATTPRQYLEYIKADGYATSSAYVNTNMNCINRHDLTKYDEQEEECEFFQKYTGTSESIVMALEAVGAKSTIISYRRLIAAANGVEGYTGTASQNRLLLKLLKSGLLKRP